VGVGVGRGEHRNLNGMEWAPLQRNADGLLTDAVFLAATLWALIPLLSAHF
jgi:hypothetical protein